MSAVALPVLLAYLALLGALAVFGAHRLRIARLYSKHRDNSPPMLSPDALPRITVQLPIFNERNVVERLINAACELDWPRDRLQIQVLDDSTDDTAELARALASRWAARGLTVEVHHRTERAGFKAGALAEGLKHATGELIAIFDADFVPRPDFLRALVPYFDLGAAAPEIGMVQARWGHLNEGASLLTALTATLLDGHFIVEHTARNRAGLFFNFNGTAGVWRADAIRAGGGWQHDTVTEDLDLSYRAQLAGWRFVYLRDLVVPSELPSTMRAYKNQQHRWAKGSVQTARKLLPRILASDLPGPVKREALSHLTLNLSYLLVLAVALLLPFTLPAREALHRPWFFALDLALFGVTLASNLRFYGLASREAHPDTWAPLARLPGVLALGIGMAVNQSRAVLEGLLGRDATFVRTPKEGDRGARLYAPAGSWTTGIELAFAAYYGAAIAWAATHERWGSVPWLSLFFVGFAYVGLSSVRRPRPRSALGAKAVDIVVEAAA